MIDEADIWKLAGKNAKAIWCIDVDNAYDEYEFAVWLKEWIHSGRRIQQLHHCHPRGYGSERC